MINYCKCKKEFFWAGHLFPAYRLLRRTLVRSGR